MKRSAISFFISTAPSYCPRNWISELLKDIAWMDRLQLSFFDEWSVPKKNKMRNGR